MTVLEENVYSKLLNTLPRIADALEKIAKQLEINSNQYPDISEQAMGPGDDDDDLPF